VVAHVLALRQAFDELPDVVLLSVGVIADVAAVVEHPELTGDDPRQERLGFLAIAARGPRQAGDQLVSFEPRDHPVIALRAAPALLGGRRPAAHLRGPREEIGRRHQDVVELLALGPSLSVAVVLLVVGEESRRGRAPAELERPGHQPPSRA
jgi:hypothetical protein